MLCITPQKGIRKRPFTITDLEKASYTRAILIQRDKEGNENAQRIRTEKRKHQIQ